MKVTTKRSPVPSKDVSLNKIEERIQVLRDTFGEQDHRVRRVESRVAEMLADDSPTSALITALYAVWATNYPGDIGVDEQFPCACREGRGYVCELDENGRALSYRPCSRCNDKVFQNFLAYLQEKGRVPGQRVEEPPLEEPPEDEIF